MVVLMFMVEYVCRTTTASQPSHFYFQMYSTTGTLVAVCNQEGVLRVNPDELAIEAKSKL